MKTKGWRCPYCSQTSSRHWNMQVHIKRRHSGIGEPLLSYNMNSSKKWNGDFNQSNPNNTNDNPPFTFATQRRESQGECRSDRNHPFYDTLDEILKVKSLANRLNNTGQDPIINSMLYAAAFSGTSSSKNSNIAQNTSDKKKNKPIGSFIHLCEKCLWGKMIPIWPQDFVMMNFSGKIVHSSCSGEDLDRINQLIEQKKIINLSTKAEEIHRSMVDLLTDFIFLSNDSKDNVRLCAIEAPPTIFSQEHEDDNISYRQILDALALPWTEGNYVDLGIVTENHWAYKLIKQEQKQKMIAMGRKELREFLNISNSTVKPFRAQIIGEGDPANIITHHFLVSCII